MGLTVQRQLSDLPLTNPNILEIKEVFCFVDSDIHNIHKCFRNYDRKQCGYIELDDFLQRFSQTDEDFVQLPYAEKLYISIQKKKDNKMFFQDFLKCFSVFCLMNPQSILQFVFDFIDADGDEKITKKDILKVLNYKDPKTGKHTFFTNYSKQVERFQIKQDKTEIQFDYFRLNADKFMFLTWPAYKLQQRIRNQLMGAQFWINQYSKVQKRQYEIKNNQKKEFRMKEKIKLLTTLKLRKFDGPFFKDSINDRKCGEIGSDTKLDQKINVKSKRRRSFIYIKGNLIIQPPQQQ